MVRKGKEMKEKMQLTDTMKQQIDEGLKDIEETLKTYNFKIPAYPNVILLEKVLLEMLPYSTAAEIFKKIDDIIIKYQKQSKEL